VNANDLLTLGLGLSEPWRVVGQKLDVDKTPSEIRIEVEAARGEHYPCPECSALCKAHDFTEFAWRHLNFFQHHCLFKARVPRVICQEHGVRRVNFPWARPGSGFTLLFEQAVMILAREMPVNAVALSWRHRQADMAGGYALRVQGHGETRSQRAVWDRP